MSEKRRACVMFRRAGHRNFPQPAGPGEAAWRASPKACSSLAGGRRFARRAPRPCRAYRASCVARRAVQSHADHSFSPGGRSPHIARGTRAVRLAEARATRKLHQNVTRAASAR
ncbi:hypothetical protein C7S16_6884 [Burkholderia thailandensis]|uniref:Uncharacterized protein n=1 Tax=Burkholderia thailandensis TaxID=57975 RepID=A0AAW9CVP7_BURTH|nr:hypothetical protein [Burkholderia thailandensis]MDW9251816.1 hypothetical protein [Burkholderia thailandensis]